MKLSAVIPCYNEEQNIPRFGAELWPVLRNLNLDFEVILVDDGSRDNTVAEIEKLGMPEARIVRHPVNRGLGAAIRTGITAAQGDWLIVLDGDLTFHPNLIPALLEAQKKNSFVDFVLGSPKLGGYGENIPLWRSLISKLANFVYRILLGKRITAINQIFRLYKTGDLKNLKLEAEGFDINVEILFKLLYRGKHCIEIPAPMTNRLFGVSKLNYAREIRRHLRLMLKIIYWRLFGF